MKCMAHRGFSGKFPENTMAAFKAAIQLDIVSSIELDVQLSKDGVPVVIHDFVLSRTTNGKGNVRDKTIDELRKFDAGSGEKIPSFEEVLQLCKNKVKLNIELKTAGDFYKGYEKTIIEMIETHEMNEDVILTSFDHEVIRKIKSLNTNIKTGLIIEGNPVLLEEQLKESGASVLSINHYFVTKNLVERMKEIGVEIVAWTVNTKERMNELKELSENIVICTNHPDKFEEMINKN